MMLKQFHILNGILNTSNYKLKGFLTSSKMVNAKKPNGATNIVSYKNQRLSDLKHKYAEIANVSGKGSTMTLELVHYDSQPSLNESYIRDIVELCNHRGITVEMCGKNINKLNIYQPMSATIQDVDSAINAFEKILQDITGSSAKVEYVFINGI